jgi:hypothetical protein
MMERGLVILILSVAIYGVCCGIGNLLWDHLYSPFWDALDRGEFLPTAITVTAMTVLLVCLKRIEDEYPGA